MSRYLRHGGHNDFGGWGATVYYSDVTDLYIEKLDSAVTEVTFEGNKVALVERQESFRFIKPDAAATCADVAPDYLDAHARPYDAPFLPQTLNCLSVSRRLG